MEEPRTVRFFDIHLHLLPGVDDGPATLDESVAFARRLAFAGVGDAVVTPHVGHPRFDVRVDEIAARCGALQAALRRAGIDVRLRPGGELHVLGAMDLGRRELELIAHGPPGRRWLLLEAPFAGIDRRFLGACERLRGLGFAPVIAHPERTEGFLPDGMGLLRGELAHGARLQVSVCSLLGRHGPAARFAAETLVRSGRADVIASDGHGGRRGHTLALGQALALRAGAPPARARELTFAAPARLLAAGVPVPEMRPAAAAPPRRPAAA